MYVVQVVQSGRGLLSAGYGSGRQQKPQCSRGVSSEALKGREGLSHGVIYMPPSCGTPQVSLVLLLARYHRAMHRVQGWR
jgi:hypothetical protein